MHHVAENFTNDMKDRTMDSSIQKHAQELLDETPDLTAKERDYLTSLRHNPEASYLVFRCTVSTNARNAVVVTGADRAKNP